MKHTRTVLALLILLTTIGCDRVTKHVATTRLAGAAMESYGGGILQFEYAENAGAFLSLGSHLPIQLRNLLLKIGVGLALAALALTVFRQKWTGLLFSGAMLAFAGGLSNLFDRIFKGSVTDFMSVGIGPVRTGIFNVADVAIMIGAVLIAIEISRARTPSFGGAKNSSNR